MVNNLVFRWPKPLLFMVLGAHGTDSPKKRGKKYAAVISGVEMLKLHQKVLQADLLWRLKQANFHRARPIEDSGRSCSVHAPRGYKHPLLCQIFVLSIVAPPAHPIRHKSDLHPYRPQEEKIDLHHTVFPKHPKCIGITNIAIAGRCKAKPVAPGCQRRNVALFIGI